MDREKFTERMTGDLVAIDQPRGDIAFIPHKLGPAWDFDPSLWPLLADAKEALGTLNGIGQMLVDPQLLLRPLQNREAITSSSIEGTYVTPEQLLLYELDPREPRSVDDRAADWMEVFNYGRALQHGCELLKSLPICNRVVREMHGILMRGVRGVNKSPGEFRKWQVQIGSSGRYIPPPQLEVGRLMNELEVYINTDDDRFDPLVRAYLIHYQFEAIHPFGDGNGRVGRALLALMIYKWLGHELPWLYLSAYFEQFREEYVEKMFRVSTHGDWHSWVEFCLRGTIEQAEDAVRRCNQFNTLKTAFHRRITKPTRRSHDLIDRLFATPILTIPETARHFNIAYHTAQSDIHRLVDVGILRPLSMAYPKSFYAPEIMSIAYGHPGETGTVT